jgi:hypothetical protein
MTELIATGQRDGSIRDDIDAVRSGTESTPLSGFLVQRLDPQLLDCRLG